MNFTAASDDFRSLLTAGADCRSKMAVFRNLFTDIQAALDAGVRRSVVRDTLAKHGLDVSMNTLKSMIYRVRREFGIKRPPGWRSTAKVKAAAEHPQQTRPDTASDASTATRAVARAPSAAPSPHNVSAAGAASVPARVVSTRLATATAPQPLLPDDWLDGELTPEQVQLLTPEQRRARRTARSNRFMLAGWLPTAKRAPVAHADQSGETGGESSKDADPGAAR